MLIDVSLLDLIAVEEAQRRARCTVHSFTAVLRNYREEGCIHVGQE